MIRSRPRNPLSPRGTSILLGGIALVGYGFLAKVMLETGIANAGGRGGLDATDYWTAARRLIDGSPLYAVEYGQFLAYSYPPLFAQVLTPFALLPSAVFVWAWRAFELLCLRYVLGSWTASGIAILVFPPVIAELETGNVHLVMGAAVALTMRGRSLSVIPAALAKFATVPLIPLAWSVDRKGLLRGLLLALVVVAVSLATVPTYWREYLTFLTTAPYPTAPYNVLAAVPIPARLAMAVIAGFLAIRWVRLAPVAVVLAYPVVWFHGLSTLLAVFAPLPASARVRRPRWWPTARESSVTPGVAQP